MANTPGDDASPFFQLRIKPDVRRYLKAGADALSARSPSPLGLGPFLLWAAKQETEKLLGMTLEEFEAGKGKPKGKAKR